MYARLLTVVAFVVNTKIDCLRVNSCCSSSKLKSSNWLDMLQDLHLNLHLHKVISEGISDDFTLRLPYQLDTALGVR